MSAIAFIVGLVLGLGVGVAVGKRYLSRWEIVWRPEEDDFGR